LEFSWQQLANPDASSRRKYIASWDQRSDTIGGMMFGLNWINKRLSHMAS
jgi:hypothetical protein